MTTEVERMHPSGPLAALEEEMERFMDGFFGRRTSRLRLPAVTLPAPEVEMYDHKDELVVKADVPGLEKPELQVAVDGVALTIKGERKREKETKEEEYYMSERSHGAFSRTIWLPTEVKADKITATLNNGVLEVHLPKAETAKVKRTTVQVK